MPGLADSSLGPTKLFRRALLDRHDIRFPEGWRLMEDQVFTLRAYFRAEVVSILADHTCYFFHRRADGRGLTTEADRPGRAFQEPAHPRWTWSRARRSPAAPFATASSGGSCGSRSCARSARRHTRTSSEVERARFFEAARAFLSGIDPDTIARLAALDRVRCELLLTGKPEELLASPAGRATSAWPWSSSRRGGGMGSTRRRSGRASSSSDADRPLVVSRRAGRWFLDARLADEWLGHPLDVTDDLERFRLESRASAHPIPPRNGG